jgi:hypothetical protein
MKKVVVVLLLALSFFSSFKAMAARIQISESEMRESNQESCKIKDY